MARLLLLLLLCILPGLALAQDEDDKGFLTRFLETNLSGLGREVRIEGFRGALSSRATFSRMTIADSKGVWIAISDGAISWNRSALLSGRVEISEMTAADIDLARAPEAGGGSTPEVRRFALPDLPVSVSVGTLRADRLRIGAPVLGQEILVAIDGMAALAGGEGSTRFSIRRTDGSEGELTLSGSFANATRIASLDLLAREGPNGIAATLLGLPGRPSAELALHGSGPIDNFTTELALATDGSARLRGRIDIRTAADQAGQAPERTFVAKLSGDISPLLQPSYRDFFGSRVVLEADGRHQPGKRTDLTRLVLESDGVDISGRLGFSAEHVPLAAALTIRLGLPGGKDLLLPVPGAATSVQNGTLKLRYDADKGDQWSLSGDLSGYRRPGLALGSVLLDGQGRVRSVPGGAARIMGTLGFEAADLRLDDPAWAAAVGPRLAGTTVFSWQDGRPLVLRNLSARAGDLGLAGNLSVILDGIDPVAEGDLALSAADMARFSLLAGRRLGGAADIRAKGRVALLSGAFDVHAQASGRGLSVDQPMADRVLAQGSEITLAARRDESGITVESFDLAVAALRARAKGAFSSQRHEATATLDVSDLSALGDAFGGQLAAEAELSGAPGSRTITLTGHGDDLRTGAAAADPLLRGTSKVAITLQEKQGTFTLASAQVANPQLSFDVSDAGDGLRVDGRVVDIGRIAPGFAGPLTVAGRVTPSTDGTGVAVDLAGPGGTNARIEGEVANDFSSVDLGLSGNAQSALLNTLIAPRSVEGPVRFDLKLSGPPSLTSLSGRIAADGLRIASPNERISVEQGSVTAEIAGGRAMIAGTASLRGGGRVRVAGPVALQPPFDAALTIDLDKARLIDPNLYSTLVSGQVTLTGPALGGAVIGGAITLAETEIAVAAPNFDGGPLPAVTHVNEPAEVQVTRQRAGLTGGARAGARVIYGLDLSVSAPARIFVRGRGLDAEMGGTVRLRGTTADAIPSGQFELIRGRLNILGKRFVLDEGLVQLLGSLVPYVYFSASSDTFGSTATIVLEGPATAPEVHFTSSTGLPEEEVISELLFGNGLNNISTFQLVQLANAIATLSGKGGEGVVARLRKNFKLDDLDIVADEDGDSALKVGKYLSDRVYSEVSVGSGGKSKVQIDLDLNADLKLRGTVGSEGQTGVGIFFDRNY